MSTVYFLRCQHGSHRYFRALRVVGLACTRDELPVEVARKASVPLIHVVALDAMQNMEVAYSYGREWLAGRP